REYDESAPAGCLCVTRETSARKSRERKATGGVFLWRTYERIAGFRLNYPVSVRVEAETPRLTQ
ncbi:MAG: hypothetical protein ACK5ZZ_11330, partial [Gemmatimonadaceae bacterium]